MSGLTEDGARTAVRNILGLETPQRLRVHLYTNNKRWAPGDTADQYDDATNYEPITLDTRTWVVLEQGAAEAVYPEITFTPLSAGNRMRIYGYYVVQEVSERLMWAERFDAPDAPYYDVDEIEVTVWFRLGRKD